MGKNYCTWYNKTSAMKRAFDNGLLDEKWVKNYCRNNGEGCVRKKKFEKDGYISPDYVLPDGTINEKLKKMVEEDNNF